MRLLDELQGMLQRTYDLDGEHRVSDFLTMNPALIEALGILPGSAGAGEQVLVSQQSGLRRPRRLHRAGGARAARSNPIRWDACTTATWRISGWRSRASAISSTSRGTPSSRQAGDAPRAGAAGRGGQVRAHGAGAHRDAPGRGRRTRCITACFGVAGIDPSLDDESRDRYRAASRYAETYCARLLERFRQRDLRLAVAELRRFYRLTQQGKLARIAQA
jgi:hypothetical protein